MRKMIFTAILTCFSSFAMADSACDTQLAAKDEIIKGLNETIVTLATRTCQSPAAVTVSVPVTCEVVCVENLVGTGWNMGQEYVHQVTLTGTDPAAVMSQIASNCNAKLKKDLIGTNFDTEKSSIVGYITAAEYNSPKWEAYLVKSFDSIASYQKFCR